MLHDKIKHNYYAFNDFNLKFPTNHPYNKPRLDSIRFTVSNNSLISQPKLLYPLINQSISITGQYPSFIRARKSVASFKVRKGSIIGLTSTLRGAKAQSFLNLLTYYILPRLMTQGINSKGYRVNNKSLFIGYNNVSLFSYITPLTIESNKDVLGLDKTGGYIQFNANIPKFKITWPSNFCLPRRHNSAMRRRGKKGGQVKNNTIKFNPYFFFYSTLQIPQIG